MKLYFSPTSPFARKCLVCASELGLRDRIDLVIAAPHPVNRDESVVAVNPLGKVPTLLLEDGSALYDSRVICEYLNSQASGALLPAAGTARWTALVDQALGDGLMDAAILVRYESSARPENLRWTAWVHGQMEKISCALSQMESHAAGFADRVDIGTITLACALSYLDFRFAALDWRASSHKTRAWFERFNARESMKLTAPPA